MIVSADIHLREESERTIFEEVLPGLEAAALGDDQVVALLGDIYHLRYRVSVRLQNRLFDFLARSKSAWVLLPGNHDQINTQGEHALEVFRELHHVDVITEPKWDQRGLWIPYRKDLEDIKRALGMSKPAHCPAVAWMHHGVKGAFMNSSRRDMEGIPTEYFNEFKRVFCGHYHMPQDLGFLSYIGSPYQTRADESGQQKRYGVWDAARCEMVWAQVNWGRKFHRVTVGPHTPLVMPENARPDDDIRIQVEAGVHPDVLGKSIADQGFTNFVITPIQKAAEARLKVDPNKGMESYAQGYVDQFGGDLNSDGLMALYREVAK